MYFKPVLVLFALTLASGSPVQEFQRRGDDAGYDDLVKSGKGRWTKLQERLKDAGAKDEPPLQCDASNKWWIDPKWANKPGASPAPRLGEMIDKAKLDITKDANYFQRNLGYPWDPKAKDPEIPTAGDDNHIRYDNYYNPKEGIIVASDLWKGKDVKDPAPYSQPTWALWKTLTGQVGAKAGDLRGVVHYSCSNEPAKVVARRICKDKDGHFMKKTLELQPDHDDFNAVLGTPNSASVLGLVSYHKNELSSKNIKGIKVWCNGDELMGLYYILG